MPPSRTTSTIAAARAALFGMLAADRGLAGVQVVFGAPDSYEDARVVALTGVRDAEETTAMVNGDRRKEVFVLEVSAKSHMQGEKDPLVVEADGLYLAERVRAVVLAGRSLPTGGPDLLGAVDTAYPSGTISNPSYPALTVPAEGGGYACLPVVLVTCTSWINRPEG